MKMIAISRDPPVSFLFTDEEPPCTELTRAVVVHTDPPFISGDALPVGSYLAHMPGVWDYPTEAEIQEDPWEKVKAARGIG
jgi:hypothetical protein